MVPRAKLSFTLLQDAMSARLSCGFQIHALSGPIDLPFCWAWRHAGSEQSLPERPDREAGALSTPSQACKNALAHVGDCSF